MFWLHIAWEPSTLSARMPTGRHAAESGAYGS